MPWRNIGVVLYENFKKLYLTNHNFPQPENSQNALYLRELCPKKSWASKSAVHNLLLRNILWSLPSYTQSHNTMSNSVVQYVLLRSDLLKDLGWSVGALVAQACHASTAILHLYRDDEQTKLYLDDLDNMHKVVLEVPNEESLKKVAEKLKENSIAHKLWIEQPENIATCLAIKPYPKDEVKKYVGKFKLYKTTIES